MNVSKTTYCIFNKEGRKYEIDLTANGNQINYDKNPKFLGVILDAGLTFTHHVKYIRERISRRLNMMKSIKERNWDAPKNSC